jgi:hypothetical protein
MSVVTALRAPRLPDLATLQSSTDLATLQSQPLPRTYARALTPRPLPAPAAMLSLSPITSHTSEHAHDRTPPRTVIPLPAIRGIAPATRAKSSPAAAAGPMSVLPRTTAESMVGGAPRVTASHAHAPAWTEPRMTAPHANAPTLTEPRMTAPHATAPARIEPHVPPPSAAAPRVTTPPVRASRVIEPLVTAQPAASPRVSTPVLLPAQPAARPSQPAVSTRASLAFPALVAPPQPPSRMPRATTPRPIAAVSSRVSWNEEEWKRSNPDVARTNAQRNESTQRILRAEPSLLRTVLGWTLTTLLLAASPAVVVPSLLDPLCDEYDWYGADATRIARECARDANVAIDLSAL